MKLRDKYTEVLKYAEIETGFRIRETSIKKQANKQPTEALNRLKIIACN